MYVVKAEGQKWIRHDSCILEYTVTLQEIEKLGSMWRSFLSISDVGSPTTQKHEEPGQKHMGRSLRKRKRPDFLLVDPKRKTYKVSWGRYE